MCARCNAQISGADDVSESYLGDQQFDHRINSQMRSRVMEQQVSDAAFRSEDYSMRAECEADSIHADLQDSALLSRNPNLVCAKADVLPNIS
jgi:hypothetical protein